MRRGSIPLYVKARINARAASGQTTLVSELIASFPQNRSVAHLGPGLVEFDAAGDIFVRTDLMGKNKGSANTDRKEDREQQAKCLKKEYSTIWGKRGKAGIIARKKGLSIRTIQKYFKDFP